MKGYRFKGKAGVSVVSVLLMVAGSFLTLFTAGCVNVSLTKTVDRAEAAPGEILTYTVLVNNAEDPISNAVVPTAWTQTWRERYIYLAEVPTTP